MKICKYCQSELAENGNFCPVCGKNNEEIAEEILTVEPAAEETIPVEETAPVEEVAVEEVKKATPGKIAVAAVAVVVLIAILVGLVAGGMGGNKTESTVPSEETPVATEEVVEETVPATIPADGNPDDETCKGSYTVTDEEVAAAMDVVVATAGDNQLTNAELQIYYWLEVQSFLQNYSSYLSYFGLDYTQPLDTQVCALVEGHTWQQFFLGSAIGTWQNYHAMAAEAEKAGFQMSEEAQAYTSTLATDLENNALTYGFASGKEMLADTVGAGADVQHYVNYMTDYYMGYEYYTSLCADFDTSDAALEAYFLEHEAEIAENGVTRDDKYVDVRHILIMPEGGTVGENGSTTYSDEEWAVAEQKAQEILDLYLTGDLSEDSFAQLANEHTADGNDANYDGIPDGGLYTDVYVGQMVPEFEGWCFDEARVTGDTGLVKTTYGWHVMYFVDSRPAWKSVVEEELTMTLANELLAEIVASYPLTVDYSAVKLGLVSFV